MTVPDEQPEFDPATWTPDKPWPKGYYKPVPGLIAAIERLNRLSSSNAVTDLGFRSFFWLLLTVPLQAFGLAAAAGNHFRSGLLHDLAKAITPVPLFLLFALALPALLFAGIIAPPGVPPRRSIAFGLAASAAMLVFFLFIIFLRPLLGLLGSWIASLMT